MALAFSLEAGDTAQRGRAHAYLKGQLHSTPVTKAARGAHTWSVVPDLKKTLAIRLSPERAPLLIRCSRSTEDVCETF